MPVEHEVIDDQLPAAVEEVFETQLAVRAVEAIVLFDLHHGEPASLGIHGVVMPGQFLLVSEELPALAEPFGLRHDRWMCNLA